MFICENCNNVIKSNHPSFKKTIEIRQKQYLFRQDANKFLYEDKIKKTSDPGGSGFETVREIIVCKNCNHKLHDIKI